MSLSKTNTTSPYSYQAAEKHRILRVLPLSCHSASVPFSSRWTVKTKMTNYSISVFDSLKTAPKWPDGYFNDLVFYKCKQLSHLFLQEFVVNERSFRVGESPTGCGVQVEWGQKLHNFLKLSGIWRQMLKETWRTAHIKDRAH